MLNSLFPISDNWSWGTYLFYVIAAGLVSYLCYKGAVFRTNVKGFNGKGDFYISKSSVFYFIAFAILVLLATLRTSEVGSDTEVYVSYFKNAYTLDFQWNQLFHFQQMEPLFQLYLFILRKITDSYTIYFFVTYSFVAGAYIKFISNYFNKQSDYFFLQLFIFFYTSNMSGTRAAIGTAILLYSYIYISKKQYGIACFLTLLACGFHYTMLFNFYVIVMTYLMNTSLLKRKKWIWIFSLAVTVLIAYFGVYQLKAILATTKYNYYSSISINELSFLGSMIYVIYGVLCFCYYRYLSSSRQESSSMLNVTIAFLLAYPVIFVTAAYRIPNYYAMPRMVCWSEICVETKRRLSTRSGRVMFNIVIELVVVLYLLLRFTRLALDGNFAYKMIF